MRLTVIKTNPLAFGIKTNNSKHIKKTAELTMNFTSLSLKPPLSSIKYQPSCTQHKKHF